MPAVVIGIGIGVAVGIVRVVWCDAQVQRSVLEVEGVLRCVVAFRPGLGWMG